MGFEPITHCAACDEPFDVYREPGNRVCDDCIFDSGLPRGDCDCCKNKNVPLFRKMVTGIETYHCEECAS